MTRSTAALIIAILFHLLILLLLWLFGMSAAKQPKPEKPEEQRIKVALKEMPTAKENAVVPNKVPPTEKIKSAFSAMLLQKSQNA